MKNIDKIFSESLKYFVQQERSQRSFASKVGISAPYLNDLLNGRRYGEDQTKRKIATALGYPDRHYEDFLDIGRIILNGTSVADNEKYTGPSEEALRARGFLSIDYSERLVLDSENLIPVTVEAKKSQAVVHGPTIRRSSNAGLQAFKVPDESMEPFLSKNDLAVFDVALNTPEIIRDGQTFVVCLEPDTGQCTVRYLSWAEKNKTIMCLSENRRFKPVVTSITDVTIVGRVIWSTHVL
ncbi:MAG: LexA family transcriptional regulator [Deltaproteobacteria bacterium]|jgi:transcriptional regulator with XRE-family HTH domain|nr:LexA family transcriptional regulator [Deltaproteobacteria bacterium]